MVFKWNFTKPIITHIMDTGYICLNWERGNLINLLYIEYQIIGNYLYCISAIPAPKQLMRNNVPKHYLQSSTTHNEDLYFWDFVTLWNEITLSINCYEMSSVVIFEINTDQTGLRNKINHIFRGVCMPSISIQTHTNPSHGEDKR